MSEAGTADLPQFDNGAKLGPNGRYTILFPLYTTEHYPYVVEGARYIVKDSEVDVCKALIAFSESTSQDKILEFPEGITAAAGGDGSSFLFLPQAAFEHNGIQCAVHELHGYYLYLVTTSSEEHARYTRKVIREALQALDFLHGKGITCGYFNSMSFIITYPQLEKASQEDVRDFYEPMYESIYGISFNDTGSAAEDRDVNLGIRLKMQNLRRAFIKTDPDKGKSAREGVECPPPEVLLGDELSPKSDIWYLGIIVANYISAAEDSTTFVGGHGSVDERASQLREFERLLGRPLPAKYQDLVQGKSFDPKTRIDGHWTFFDHCRDLRVRMTEIPLTEDIQGEMREDVFCEESVRSATELLKQMLAWDPDERISASEALQHEFFKLGQ